MFKVDAGAVHGVDGAAQRAVDAERQGYDGFWSGEANHDPFYPLLVASGVTSTLTLGTAIAVAFSRNPMSMAVCANDIQAATGGRFILGLGSQIRAHIERRYSMPWSKPAARMREYVRALHAIWASWQSGDALDFRGDFYSHTLMTPMFSPGPNLYGRPPVLVAGLGGEMTRVAGEVADGFICHPFTIERYLREVTLPALAEGRSRSRSRMAGFEIFGQRLVTTGATQEELDQAIAWTRERIAFYELARRYGDTLTRVSFSPAISSAQVWQDVRAGLVEATSPAPL